MDIRGATVLVTGANRGIGRALVEGLLVRGAAKVYAAAREPVASPHPAVVPLRLDITDPAQVEEATLVADDVTILVNNAGITAFASLVDGDLADIRREMETNYFGTLAMVRAFAPVLARSGGGAMLNVLSVMAWRGIEFGNGYGASKAAAWAMTNALRLELMAQGTLVTGLLMASTDTDMMAAFDVPKNCPSDVAEAALVGLEAGALEVLADEETVAVKATLSADPAEVYPQVVGGRS